VLGGLLLMTGIGELVGAFTTKDKEPAAHADKEPAAHAKPKHK